MADNITFLGDVADDFDSQLRQAEHILDRYVESRSYSTTSMVIASSTIAFMRFGQSFVDVLRIGNGVRRGGWKGIAGDSLRILTVAGVAGATISRLSRVLAVTQQAGTYTCTWISTANALRRTGQRFFVSLDELATSAGVDLAAVAKAGGTTAQQCERLVEALRKMGLAVEKVTPTSSNIESIAELLKARGNSALAFAVEYGNEGARAGHQLFATFSRSAGLVIIDTTGKIYRGAQAFSQVYKNARLFQSHMFFIDNAAIIAGAEGAATPGGLAAFVLELLPVPFKNKPPASSTQQPVRIPGPTRQ
jgi:hypothetical protein